MYRQINQTRYQGRKYRYETTLEGTRYGPVSFCLPLGMIDALACGRAGQSPGIMRESVWEGKVLLVLWVVTDGPAAGETRRAMDSIENCQYPQCREIGANQESARPVARSALKLLSSSPERLDGFLVISLAQKERAIWSRNPTEQTRQKPE